MRAIFCVYERLARSRNQLFLRFSIHKIPNFIEKSQRAGVTRVFIGLENINPANLIAAKKRQNKITEYRIEYARKIVEMGFKKLAVSQAARARENFGCQPADNERTRKLHKACSLFCGKAE